MSAKKLSRAYEQGQVKKMQRMKRSVEVILLSAPVVRNPVTYAMIQRRLSSGAGEHIRSQGAQRRAQKMALQRSLRDLD